MTGIAQLMKGAGYSTHMVGKVTPPRPPSQPAIYACCAAMPSVLGLSNHA